MPNTTLNEYLATLGNSATYLNIEIEETLSWNIQIEVLAKKNSSELKVFFQNLDITFQWKL